MQQHNVVTPEEWLTARIALLAKEKAHTQQNDELARLRRELPWVKVTKPYIFETLTGPKFLGDLFDGRSQLVLYHFMFGPEWEQGCQSCSLVTDHLEGSLIHLANRDITLIAASRAPIRKIEIFKQRMGWNIPWVSTFSSDFNFDFRVSFTPDQVGAKTQNYNYGRTHPSEEAPGISVFYRNPDGEVFHTYSSFGRGVESLIGAYDLIDFTPNGREDEPTLAYPMAWVRHHDRYPEPKQQTQQEAHACCSTDEVHA